MGKEIEELSKYNKQWKFQDAVNKIEERFVTIINTSTCGVTTGGISANGETKRNFSRLT